MINFKKTAAFLTAIICVMSMCSCEKGQTESEETQQSSITVMTDAEQANDSDASDNAITKEDRYEEKTDDSDNEETASSDNSDEEVSNVEEALVKAEETTVTAAEQTKKNAVIFGGNGGFGGGPRGDFNGDPPDNNFGGNGTPPDNNFGGSGTPPDFPNKRNDATVQ